MKIYNWNELSVVDKKKILSRPLINDSKNIRAQVKAIIDQVKADGDDALLALTKKFDKASLSQQQVTPAELSCAAQQISVSAKRAIEFAKQQIETNHRVQLPQSNVVETCEGVYCERQSRPIERIGLYIPGGSAPLVSTVLMLGVPSQIAGCPIRILCTPPNAQGIIDPHLLVAASLCGIERIYKVGGAQAIAAMAYGTETIPKVDKIFGPGNTWVTQAKMLVAEDPQGASIDMPAGPSELMVIADEDAHPAYIAADLLSQAEHGTDSQVLLVTVSKTLALSVQAEVKLQVQTLPRKNIIEVSLANSSIIVVEDIQQAITVSNTYAPEHLILQVNNPDHYTANIYNAGAVFLGPWTPETVGDYVTGANHVLPTYGYTRNDSGLGVADFMKFISFQKVTKKGLENISTYAEILADIEGLQAHKQAVAVRRFEKVSNYE